MLNKVKLFNALNVGINLVTKYADNVMEMGTYQAIIHLYSLWISCLTQNSQQFQETRPISK